MTEIPEGAQTTETIKKKNCLNRRSRLHAMRCLPSAALASMQSLIKGVVVPVEEKLLKRQRAKSREAEKKQEGRQS